VAFELPAVMTVNLSGLNSGRESQHFNSTKLNSTPAFPCSFEIEKPIARLPQPDQPRDELGRFWKKGIDKVQENTA
jgi:hypothetical protein